MAEDGQEAPVKKRARRLPPTGAHVVRRWNAAREDLFFATLAETANVKHSAAMADISVSAAHSRRRNHPDFAARWLVALEEGYVRLELLLLEQAVEGFERVETVTSGDGTVQRVKTVRSFAHGTALALFKHHAGSVERHRAMIAAQAADDGQAVERVRAEIDRVRARLRGEG